MPGAISQFLARDHARLDALLATALASEVVEAAAYEAFRAGLLHHIAIEEKVMVAEARARHGEPLPILRVIRADHAALASLLVPSPSHALLRTIREVLDEHNPLEERADGLYATCEHLLGDDAGAVLARMQAVPPPRISAHVDEPRIHAHIERMLAARAALPRP